MNVERTFHSVDYSKVQSIIRWFLHLRQGSRVSSMGKKIMMDKMPKMANILWPRVATSEKRYIFMLHNSTAKKFAASPIYEIMLLDNVHHMSVCGGMEHIQRWLIESVSCRMCAKRAEQTHNRSIQQNRTSTQIKWLRPLAMVAHGQTLFAQPIECTHNTVINIEWIEPYGRYTTTQCTIFVLSFPCKSFAIVIRRLLAIWQCAAISVGIGQKNATIARLDSATKAERNRI